MRSHQIVSLKVSGGFLDGMQANYAAGLNCVIGARGTGKTTTLEFMNYALLGCQGERDAVAPKRLTELVKKNLGGGRIELTIQTKDGLRYTISRAAEEPSLVTDAGGQPIEVTFKSGLFNTQIFSQNEVEGIADDPISSGMRHLQKAIGGGSKETEDAFVRLGTSAAELSKKTPEAALALLADRLKQVTDLNEKAALAQTLFGRSGVELLPILSEGSAGLNAAANAAQKSGAAFSGPALVAAERLYDSFKGLEGALLSVRNALGTALEGALTPLIQSLSTIAQAVAQWIAQNPAQVQAIFNIGLAVSALGAAFTVLGAAIYAAMTPAVLAIAAIAGIGMAMLSVTDLLGVTATGFGELFNSIRVGGTGLGTWFAGFTIELAKMWNSMATFMESIWDAFVNGAKDAGSLIYQSLVWVPQKLLEAFRWMVNSAGEMLNELASVWNETLGTVAGQIQMKFGSAGVFDSSIEALQFKQNQIAGARADRNVGYTNDRDLKFKESQLTAAELARQEQALFSNDPQDGQGGVHVDTQKFKDGLADIGDSIGGVLHDLLGQIPELSGYKPDDLKTLTPFGADSGTINNAIAAAQQHFDVAGTFNAAAAGEMGFGSSIQERTAKASEETARNTRQTLDLVRNNTASFT